MFAAFLSTSQINEYLRQLFESGLVEYVAGSRRYRTTSKGMELLESYEKLSSMVENMPHAPSIQK
jgi:predicted transcriptional regulator